MERETLIIPARINAGVFRRFALYDTFVRQGRWRSPALFAGILGAAAAVCLLMRQRREGAALLGGVLLVEGRIVGFSLGEIIGDTLFTHIEKADRDYEGCYQMLVAQFAQQFAGEGVAFINREDDTGDLGLRTSKLSYHPVALLEKYTVTVDEPCNYCQL